MGSSQATGFVHVSEASLGQFRTQFLEILAPAPAYAPPIRVDLLLLGWLAQPLPRPGLVSTSAASSWCRPDRQLAASPLPPPHSTDPRRARPYAPSGSGCPSSS